MPGSGPLQAHFTLESPVPLQAHVSLEKAPAGGGPGDRITSIPPGTASRTDPARRIAERPGAPGTDRGPDHVRKPSPRPTLPRPSPPRFLPAAALALLWGSPARAGGPAVIELFTSQSCYSCPPAEALLGELVERENLIALEFHVDYWTIWSTAPPGAGRMSFSDPAFTARQRRYAARIRNGGVYTPQVVVDGVVHAVGSKRGRVLRLVERSAGVVKPVLVSVRPAPGGGFTVTLEPKTGRPSAAVLLAPLRPSARDPGRGRRRTRARPSPTTTSCASFWRWATGPAIASRSPSPTSASAPTRVAPSSWQAHDQGAILGAAACPS